MNPQEIKEIDERILHLKAKEECLILLYHQIKDQPDMDIVTSLTHRASILVELVTLLNSLTVLYKERHVMIMQN